MKVRNAIVLSALMAVLLCVNANAGQGPREGHGGGPGGPGGGPAPVGPMGPGRPAPWQHPPDGAHRIVVAGTPYWFYGGVYYRLSGDSYVVVSAPVISILPGPYSVVVIRVQVQKKNGQGSVEIELKRQEQGYLGPQGEFYPEMPAADRLTEMYGGE